MLHVEHRPEEVASGIIVFAALVQHGEVGLLLFFFIGLAAFVIHEAVSVVGLVLAHPDGFQEVCFGFLEIFQFAVGAAQHHVIDGVDHGDVFTLIAFEHLVDGVDHKLGVGLDAILSEDMPQADLPVGEHTVLLEGLVQQFVVLPEVDLSAVAVFDEIGQGAEGVGDVVLGGFEELDGFADGVVVGLKYLEVAAVGVLVEGILLVRRFLEPCHLFLVEQEQAGVGVGDHEEQPSCPGVEEGGDQQIIEGFADLMLLEGLLPEVGLPEYRVLEFLVCHGVAHGSSRDDANCNNSKFF